MNPSKAATSLSNGLIDAVSDASFPDSEEILSSSLDQNNIPPLLDALNTARNDLSDTVRTVSKQEAGDVDGWIEQAKRLQADIARCKEDARNIVQEHERIEALFNVQDQARNKTVLLEAELAFNVTLEKQILLISDTYTALSKVDEDIGRRHVLATAQAIPSIAGTIEHIPGAQPRALLTRMHSDLRQRLSKQLKQNLDEHIPLSSTTGELSLQILDDLPAGNNSVKTASGNDANNSSLHLILGSMSSLDLRHQAVVQISQRIDAALLPHLYRRSKLKVSNASPKNGALAVTLSSDAPTTLSVILAAFEITRYLHDFCPSFVRDDVMQKILSWLLPLLITEWLNPAVPSQLADLVDMNELQSLIENFNAWLKDKGYGNSKDFTVWMQEIPRIWLAKRRSLALDAVRTAFEKASGSTRQVERIERQTVTAQESQQVSVDDDWADNWEEEDDQKDVPSSQKAEEKSDGDDESDAWGFDADEQANSEATAQSATVTSSDSNQDDEGDAWGWGDEDDIGVRATPAKKQSATESNGLRVSKPATEDVVLRENYSITDIPDYMIEQIGIDLADDHDLRVSPSTYFKSGSASGSDLSSLPSLTLAMFRAIAGSSYQSQFSPPLSNMHLYNDVLYLASKVADGFGAFGAADSRAGSVLSSQTPVLEKFARQVYTSEISTHRTILLDLLDAAQGFVSCTRSPYAETCETAIISTTDYLRSIHSQWSSILSPSHLYQSIGNLSNSIMRKIIEDIEDMEDISEPESRKLLSLCEPVSALQDLFIARQPAERGWSDDSQEVETVSMIAVHCGSYLRFQYLQQILESNLVEIKYLWTDAGLSLEFRSDEVVDLIQALFAESPQRRSAINTIKSGG